MTANQKKLLTLLGPEYHMEVVDYEECICRTIGNRSIEISGTATKQRPYNVYVWEVLDEGVYGQIVEKHFNIRGDAQLIATLNGIVSGVIGNLPR